MGGNMDGMAVSQRVQHEKGLGARLGKSGRHSRICNPSLFRIWVVITPSSIYMKSGRLYLSNEQAVMVELPTPMGGILFRQAGRTGSSTSPRYDSSP